MRNAGEKRNAALFSEVRLIKAAGARLDRHEWSLYFATLPAFERGARSNLPAFVLVSGVGVSLLLFGITWMLARSRTQAFRAGADLGEANRELEQANTELQRSREGLISAREEERRRLRRDLHDGVGPQLAALMLELETAGDLVSENPEASALMAKLSRRAREIVSDVRRSVHALRPPALDELGLVGALEGRGDPVRPGGPAHLCGEPGGAVATAGGRGGGVLQDRPGGPRQRGAPRRGEQLLDPHTAGRGGVRPQSWRWKTTGGVSGTTIGWGLA